MLLSSPGEALLCNHNTLTILVEGEASCSKAWTALSYICTLSFDLSLVEAPQEEILEVERLFLMGNIAMQRDRFYVPRKNQPLRGLPYLNKSIFNSSFHPIQKK